MNSRVRSIHFNDKIVWNFYAGTLGPKFLESVK